MSMSEDAISMAAKERLTDKVARALLVDAIIGRGLRRIEEAMHYERIGLARFTGNQHNESWSWDREKLEQLGEALGEGVAALYWREP